MGKVKEWRTANPEEAKQEFMATWGAADTDGDGLISRSEYDAFIDMMTQNGKARFGKAVEVSAADRDYMFELSNKINPDTNGFGMGEMGLFRAAQEKFKAEGN